MSVLSRLSNRYCTQGAGVKNRSLISHELPCASSIVARVVLLLVVGKAMRDGCKSAAGSTASNWFKE